MFHFCLVRRGFSAPAAAHEHVSSYQRFVDPPLMNRYYYQLVDKSPERVSSVIIIAMLMLIVACS